MAKPSAEEPDPGALQSALQTEVHLWRVELDRRQGSEGGPDGGLAGVLSTDERQRMERLRSQVHRRRFCVARGALRLLLARYLGCAAAALEFDYGEHGKPSVASSNPNPSDLRFNLSHSEGEAMLAVARGIDVGVDIQQVAAQVDCVGIARRYFSNAEVQRLLNLSPAAQSEAFFECWTRKESYLKACGGGLQLPLSDFEVAFGPDTAAGLLRVGWDASEVQRWEMVDLATAEGFRGALTMERCGRTRRYFEAESVLVNHPAAGFSQ